MELGSFNLVVLAVQVAGTPLKFPILTSRCSALARMGLARRRADVFPLVQAFLFQHATVLLVYRTAGW